MFGVLIKKNNPFIRINQKAKKKKLNRFFIQAKK